MASAEIVVVVTYVVTVTVRQTIVRVVVVPARAHIQHTTGETKSLDDWHF